VRRRPAFDRHAQRLVKRAFDDQLVLTGRDIGKGEDAQGIRSREVQGAAQANGTIAQRFSGVCLDDAAEQGVGECQDDDEPH
jgi:hypothetical protein